MSVVDEAILDLESPEEPWSVHLEIALPAPLDEARLRWAVMAALRRHPRACARLATATAGRHRHEWEITPFPDVDPLEVIRADTDAAIVTARADFQSRVVPLDTSPPFRIRLVRQHDGDVLMLNLHHAAGDGMAALVLLQSVARAYAGRDEAVAAPPSGPLDAPVGRVRRRALVAELLEAARPSGAIAHHGGRDAPGYGFHLLRLDAHRTRALRERARDGTTVNDLLVAALHLSVDRWNAEHGEPSGRLSVLLPVNLRRREQWRDGFGNLTFMVPVATGPGDRISSPATVDAVRRRTRAVKEKHSAAAVASSLQPLQLLPGAARRWIARRAAGGRLAPTTLLSNLGPLEHDLDFGAAVGSPTGVWFSPPIRMPLGLAVGAVTAAEKLHLTFRARHPLFGPEALDGFASGYESALNGLLDAEEPLLSRLAWPACAA